MPQATLGNFVQTPSGSSRSAAQTDIRSSVPKTKSHSTNISKADDAASSSKDASVKDDENSDVEHVVGERKPSSMAASRSNGRKRARIVDSEEDSDQEVGPQSPPIKSKKVSGAATKETQKASSEKASEKQRMTPSSSKPNAFSKLGGKTQGKQASSKISDEPNTDLGASESRSRTASQSPEASSAEEDQEDRKSHVKIASIFQKPSERKAQAADAGPKWENGKSIPYGALAHTFSQIEATTKRLEIQSILSDFLSKVIARASKPEEVTQVVYLCINRLCPDYLGLELGLGEGLIVKALAQSFGREIPKIKKDLEKVGDLGLVAMNSRAQQPTMFKASALTVPGVFKILKEIATTSGAKSQEKKLGLIKKLLASCQGEETKWIIRSLEGKLRIGLAEKTVIIGLAHAAVMQQLGKKKDKMSAEELSAALEDGTSQVKAVYSEMPNYDHIIPALLDKGIQSLRATCKLTPGIPLKPMLAKPTKAISEVLDRFEGKAFTCEYKYDGERAQVHFYVPGEAQGASGETAGPQNQVEAPGSSKKGKLGVFSRNSEDMSVKYPDLLESIPHFVKPETKSFVLDAEVTAWKKPEVDEEGNVKDAGGLLPFQQLSTRKRKDVELNQIKVKVKLFAFDLLYVNGESLLHMDLAARREKLREHFIPVENEFDFATSQDCNTVDEIQAFLDASVADRCEGLMVKMLQGEDAFYEPSRRSMNWLKVKKDYLSGTGDSLDLVVIGAYHGKGKRTNVYGAFLLGCWDSDSESYQSVCKIGTGFSEANLEEFTQILKPLELTTKKGYYDMGEAKPDVFFEPKIVWEVLTADLSLSPVYTAAKGSIESRGISLRFPRFIRIRDDKEPEDSTSPDQIADMYRAQASASKSKGGGGGGEDDYW
ncbi:unnamed protein product [Sympodiomycopsis kandeliae]